MTNEHSICERQQLRQLFWELIYGQAVYVWIFIVTVVLHKLFNPYKFIPIFKEK